MTTLRRWQFGLAFTSLLVAAAGLVDQYLHRDRYAEYSLIHMPARGKCPDGFALAPKVFSRGGKPYDGCQRVGGLPIGQGGELDALYPGESVMGTGLMLPCPEFKELHPDLAKDFAPCEDMPAPRAPEKRGRS